MRTRSIVMPSVSTRRQFLASGTLAGAALAARPLAALAG
jgi:hypothetical protein